VIATVELSHCLPPTIPVTGLGEMEAEIIGADQVVRINPGMANLSVYRNTKVEVRPWVDDPIVAMLDHLVAVCGKPSDGVAPDRLRDALTLVEAASTSLATGRPVRLGQQAKAP
jgi:hypothetical protein